MHNDSKKTGLVTNILILYLRIPSVKRVRRYYLPFIYRVLTSLIFQIADRNLTENKLGLVSESVESSIAKDTTASALENNFVAGCKDGSVCLCAVSVTDGGAASKCTHADTGLDPRRSSTAVQDAASVEF